MMAALLFHGYATGTMSSRKIERAGRYDIAFRYIAAGALPDHGTIAAFHRRHLAELSALFVRVRLVAREVRVLKVGPAAKAMRGRWGIENVLHWRENVSMGEDVHNLRADDAPSRCCAAPPWRSGTSSACPSSRRTPPRKPLSSGHNHFSPSLSRMISGTGDSATSVCCNADTMALGYPRLQPRREIPRTSSRIAFGGSPCFIELSRYCYWPPLFCPWQHHAARCGRRSPPLWARFATT